MTGASAGRVVGIVLTAGRSSRAGFAKALATFGTPGTHGGETLAARIGRTLREGGCDDVWYVVAAPHDVDVKAALPGERFVTNPAPERGMLSSLQAGLRAVTDADGTGRGATDDAPTSGATDAVVVALIDHPRVRAETVRLLVDTLRTSGATVTRPQYGERRGHPFVLAREEFARALALAPDGPGPATMRDVVRGARDARVVGVDDPYVLDDLDDEAKLRAAGIVPPKYEP